MSVIEAIENGAETGRACNNVGHNGPAANAQQPSAAAMSTAKELISVAGATSLFGPTDRGAW